MALATLRYHDPNCSGCPACNARHAATLDETRSRRQAVETQRAAADRLIPPDPYAKATEKAPRPPCPFDTPGYTGRDGVPPDPYKAGIDRMRTEQRKKENR
jgi:hypothetical protein